MNRPLSNFKLSIPNYSITDDVAEKAYAYAVLLFIQLLIARKKSKTITFGELWKAAIKYSPTQETDCFGLRFRWQRDNAYDFKAMHLRYAIIKLAANGLLEVWETKNTQGGGYVKLITTTKRGSGEAKYFFNLLNRNNAKFLGKNLSRRIGQFKNMLLLMVASFNS